MRMRRKINEWISAILSRLQIKLLDQYIIRKFMGTYFFAIMAIVVIVTVFDMTEKIDDFLQLHAPMDKIIFQYYFNFIPFFINQFSGLITFISVIFFTSKMAYNTEIVAILSSGVSFKRMMWPYFISSVLIALISLSLSLYIIPRASVKQFEFEAVYLKKGMRNNYEPQIYRQIGPNSVLSLTGYQNKSKSADFLAIETYDGGRIVSSLTARNVTFNPETRHWTAARYITRTFEGEREHLEKREGLDTLINLSADEIGKVNNHIRTLNIHELSRFIKEQKEKGSDLVAEFEVERQNRFAYPFSTFILTLIGVSLSSRKVRGGTGLHISVGIALCFSYILCMQFATEFAKGNVVPPFVAIWTPNVIFAFIAAYLYKRAPK